MDARDDMRKRCTAPGCDNVLYSRGVCTKHYRDGSTLGELNRQAEDRDGEGYREAMRLWDVVMLGVEV